MHQKFFGLLLVAILVVVAIMGIQNFRDYPRPANNHSKVSTTFVEEIPQTCKNLCGDGVCQEIVCQAIGCPCSESVDSCPVDCRIYDGYEQ